MVKYGLENRRTSLRNVYEHDGGAINVGRPRRVSTQDNNRPGSGTNSLGPEARVSGTWGVP